MDSCNAKDLVQIPLGNKRRPHWIEELWRCSVCRKVFRARIHLSSWELTASWIRGMKWKEPTLDVKSRPM